MIDPFKIKQRGHVQIAGAPGLPYTFLDLEQGTAEWHKARMEHVTASDIPPLVGITVYKTRQSLMAIKLAGHEPDVSDFKRRLFEMGHLAEEAGRRWANQKLGLNFRPRVLKSVIHPHLMASLDGFDVERDMIFEAKYLGAKALQDVAHRKLKSHHVAQVQAQLLVSGAKKAMYFAMDPNGNAEAIPIYPDQLMQQRIATESAKFFKEWQENKK